MNNTNEPKEALALNDRRKRFFEYCKERASKEKAHPIEDSYTLLDFNQDNLEDTCQSSKEIFDDISRMFRQSLVKNIQENQRNKETGSQGNFQDIEFHRLPEEDDPTPEVYSGKNNFSFEPLMDFKPLKHQRGGKNCRESSSYLALTSQLFRHITLASSGETLDYSRTEQSVRQNLDLLEFLKEHQPFEDKINERLLGNDAIFKYRWLLKYVTSSEKRQNDSKLEKKLQKILNFCKNNVKMQKQASIYEELQNLLLEIRETKSESENLAKHESFNKVSKICEGLLDEIKKKLKLMNKASFYYIKKQFEALYSLAGPGRNSKTPIENDEEAIKYFAKKALKALKKFVENYNQKYEPKIVTQYIGEAEEVQDSEQFDPRKTYTSLLVCYYACIRELKLSLLDRLSVRYDDASQNFIETLIGHPSSFFMSKDVLNINWSFLDDLIFIYTKYLGQSDQSSQNDAEDDSGKDLSEMNMFCANLYIYLEATNQDQIPTNFVISKPIFCDETNNSPHPNSFNSNESLAKSLCSGLKDKIDILIGKAILEIKKGRILEVKEIKELGFDFYSTHYNLELSKCIKKEIDAEIKKIPTIHAEHLKDKSDRIGNCHFSYTVKENDLQVNQNEDDDEFEKAANGEGKQKKISLFNYDFLREILSEQPASYLTPKNICILQKGDSQIEDQVNEKKTLFPQNDPEVLDQVEEKKTFNYNPDSEQMQDEQPVFFQHGNQTSLLQKPDEELQDQVDSELPPAMKKLGMQENYKLNPMSEILMGYCRILSYHSQQSVESC